MKTLESKIDLAKRICIKANPGRMMKVIYNRENNRALDLTKGKVYDVIKTHHFENWNEDWYVLIDDSGEDYCYPPELFDIVEE